MQPIAKTARFVGALYLSTLPLAIYFWFYLPGKLIVRGNAMATAENVRAHETLFRFSILGDLFAHVILLCSRRLPAVRPHFLSLKRFQRFQPRSR